MVFGGMTWIYIAAISALFAYLEIQIEGNHGWAEKLPTWKIKNPVRGIIGWPYVTGYHVSMWALFISLFHWPFFVGNVWNWKNEFFILQGLAWFLYLEDFWWFVLNPAWGLRRFFTTEIPWHPHKFLFFPLNYWIGLLGLFALYFISLLFS